jgi:TolB-like protein
MKRPLYFLFSTLLLVPWLCFAGKDQITIAVNDLSGEGIEASETRIISDRFRSELINTQVFRVMERGEMESILKEQGFQQSGVCTDKSCIVEMGQILGVKQIFAGSIGKIGGMYTISTRMIDVATGEVRFSVTVDCKCAISDVLTKSVPSIAQQIVAKTKMASDGQAAPAAVPATNSEQQGAQKEKKKSIVSRWYFWVPAAAVIVGGAVVGYVVLSKKENRTQEQQTGGVLIQW